MSVFLHNEYLRWLYARTGDVDEVRESQTYWKLFEHLANTEFAWVVPHDDNRVEDGKEQRYIFLQDIRVSDDDVDQGWLLSNCSFLEMLVGLVKLIQFDMDRTESYWFWLLMQNVGLDQQTDDVFNAGEVDSIVQRVTWRTYSPTGQGGLFPLKHPSKDQRGVELWYQCQEWLQEDM